ncbi:MAG: glycosyltransferase [bacterium]|nr:MAG: glycosyltransferase [bacterium]
MKILYFSFVELDVPNACQTHTLGVLRGFSNNSCEVDAVVPRSKKVRPKIPGVRFYYLWPWRFSALGKLLVKILGGAFLFFLCLLKKFDAIYVRELEINPFPRWCSIIFRIPFYIEINSILPRSMEIAGVDKNRLLRIERYQAADFKQASGLIVPSYPRLRWAIDYYNLKASKVHMILNGTDISSSRKMRRSIVLKKMNLLQNGFYLGFLGSIWNYYDLMSILKAMELCQQQIPNLHMIMIGGGPEIAEFKKKAQEMRMISRIVFLGYVQPECLFEVMGAIDVGLMNMRLKGLVDLGPVTTRFATYAAFQMPVIANSTYMGNYPNELKQGLSVVPPENPQALSDMILWLYYHPEEGKAKAKILYDFVIRKLTWNAVAMEILDIIEYDGKLK